MIDSTSPSDRTLRTDLALAAGSKNPVNSTGRDCFSAESSAVLKAALARCPEVRPEVVARGRLLLADPTYPSVDVLRKVGAVILASPDLAADEN